MAYSAIRVLVWMVFLSQFEVGLSDDILLMTTDRERVHVHIIYISGAVKPQHDSV